MATTPEATQSIPPQDPGVPVESKIESEIDLMGDLDDQFVTAAMNGNIRKMQALLNLGVNINGTEQGDVPLIYAALYGGLEAVCFLISMGADVNKICPSGSSALEGALNMAYIDSDRGKNNISQYRAIVEYLLKHKADVNHINSIGFSIIQHAALLGDDEIFSLLMQHGAVITHLDSLGHGQSSILPMLMMCQPDPTVEAEKLIRTFNCLKKTITLLIAHGFNIDYQPIMVKIPMVNHNVLALEEEPDNVIQYLIHQFSGYSPLMIACEIGYLPLVEFILQCGANVNRKGGLHGEETPLSIAARKNHSILVQYLLEVAGADAHYPLESCIVSPVSYACNNENWDLMRYLISAGAAAEPPDALQLLVNFLVPSENASSGHRIFQSVMRLFEYAWSGNLTEGTTFQQMMAGGAHFNQRTTHIANTPLHLACLNNNEKFVREFLRELSKTPEDFQLKTLTSINFEGHTAFDIAAQNSSNVVQNIFKNLLQPFVDNFVFNCKYDSSSSPLPVEILQYIWTLTLGKTHCFAKTSEGVKLISDMFEKALVNHAKLIMRHSVASDNKLAAERKSAKESQETKKSKDQSEARSAVAMSLNAQDFEQNKEKSLKGKTSETQYLECFSELKVAKEEQLRDADNEGLQTGAGAAGKSTDTAVVLYKPLFFSTSAPGTTCDPQGSTMQDQQQGSTDLGVGLPVATLLNNTESTIVSASGDSTTATSSTASSFNAEHQQEEVDNMGAQKPGS